MRSLKKLWEQKRKIYNQMMQLRKKDIYTFKIATSTLSLIVPGSGLFMIGKWKSAIFFITITLSTIIIISKTRALTSPSIFLLFLIFYLAATITSSAFCFNFNPSHLNNRTHIFRSIIYTITVTAIIITGFIFHKSWLGLSIYFIPSTSMQPTLEPGQFVIVDTFAYEYTDPNIGDVIVFEKHGNWLIKRITDWPKSTVAEKNTWYVMGDNRENSQDSRYFGGIHGSKIDGKAVFILLSLNEHYEIIAPAFKEIE